MAESSAYGPKPSGPQPEESSAGLAGNEADAHAPGASDASDRTVIQGGQGPQLLDDPDRTITAAGPPPRVLGPQVAVSDGSHSSARVPNRRNDDRTVISSQPPLPAPGAATGSPISEALLGEWLDHFELLECVGGGGMGVVFRARDSRLDRIVALKILSSDRARDRETVRRFQNEAQSAARLDHENIARVYYVGEDRGLNYIAFEFVDGTNIRDMVMERGPLPVAEAVSYMMQLAHALAHASGRNVIHRDIKPSNVLVTRDGRVKLVDMGLARLSQVEHTEDITASGVTLGTFDYISPEQARDPRNADVRSDIYSLGCTFYFMLTGRPPFPHGNVLQKLLQHQGETPPDPRDTNPEIPEDVVRVLRRLLVKDPAKRYQSAAALIDDLSRLADQLGIDLSNLGAAYVARQPSPWKRAAYRHLPWLVPVASLVVALLVLDAHWRNEAVAPAPFEPAPHLSRPVKTSDVEPTRRGTANSTTANDTATATVRPVVTSLLPPLEVQVLAPVSEAGLTPAEQVTELAMPSASTALTVAAFSSDRLFAADGLAGGGTAATASASALALADDAPGFALTYPDQLASGMAAVAQPHPEGVLIVRPDPDPALSYQFASLAEACNAAEAGDIIELHYSGRRREMPVRIARGLTIRAGQKSNGEPYRPVVVFSPDAVDTARSMVSISGARLSLQNVAFEMKLPAGGLNGAWTMAELQQAELEAENCTFTLSRPQGHETPSFFRVRADQRAETMMMSSAMFDPAPRRGVGRVKLVNCIARGEAVLVFAEQMAPLTLEWRNGLFASIEALLSASGGVLEQGSSRLSITLDHITALIPGGLCVLETSDDYPRSLPLEVQCTNSVLVGSGGNPLIEVSAAESVSWQKSQVSWQGSRNIYDGFTTFWRIRDRSLSEPPVDINAASWQTYWDTREQSAIVGPVVWKGRSPLTLGISLDQHSPRDYQFDEQFQVQHTSADEGPIGFQADRLPPTDPPIDAPLEPSTAVSSSMLPLD